MTIFTRARVLLYLTGVGVNRCVRERSPITWCKCLVQGFAVAPAATPVPRHNWTQDAKSRAWRDPGDTGSSRVHWSRPLPCRARLGRDLRGWVLRGRVKAARGRSGAGEGAEADHCRNGARRGRVGRGTGGQG